MRVAVCFSGMIRTGIQTFGSIKQFIGEYWGACDFFVHTWDIDFQNPLHGETWDHYHEFYKTEPLSQNKIDNFAKLYAPKTIVIEKYWDRHQEIYNQFKSFIVPNHTKWWFPLFYSWNMSVGYMCNYASQNNISYDYCIKLRPDILFSGDIKLKDYLDLIDNNKFGINQVWNIGDTLTCDDIIFISKPNIMAYASVWWKYRIKSGEYKTDILPHVSFYQYVTGVGAKPVNLELLYMSENNNISIYREECSIFDPINELNKCSECDKFLFHELAESEVVDITDAEFEVLREHVLKIRSYFPEKQK